MFGLTEEEKRAIREYAWFCVWHPIQAYRLYKELKRFYQPTKDDTVRPEHKLRGL